MIPAPPPERGAGLVERGVDLSRTGRLETLQGDEHVVEMARPVSWRQVERRDPRERRESDRVAGAQHDVRQSSSHELGVAQLADGGISDEAHRLRPVHKQEGLEVGVLLEETDVEPIGAAVEAPIESAHVVTLLIGAVPREVLSRSEERRSVATGDETAHDGPGDEVETAEPLEHLRREQARRPLRARLRLRRHQRAAIPLQDAAARRSDLGQESGDHLVGGMPLRLGLEVDQDPMSEHGRCDASEILGSDV